MLDNFKTAEFVSPMHPDKMCDRISDTILDLCLSKDENSRVAVETMGGHGKVYICGEITCKYKITNKEIKKIVKEISGINKVEINLVKQSPEISNGVDTGGAGDQGIMVGYACNENESMIPQEIYLARELCNFIYKEFEYDGKTQITLNNKNEIDTVVISWCRVSSYILKIGVKAWLKENGLTARKIYCNPAGDWNIGGFDSDTGLTGRKLAVDSYGPRVPIGGGAFSGKDSSKVDRSGAYKARQIAVQELKEHNAKEVIVKIAYAIGVAKPVMVTAEIDKRTLDITEKYKCRPNDIIKELELKTPMFRHTAKAGHFGNKFNWDK